MYAFVFWFVLLGSLIAMIGTFVFLVRTHTLTMFDIALPILPVVLWFGLMLTGLRLKSLANLIEPFALVPILAVCLLFRAFSFRSSSNGKRSIAALVLGLAGAVAIYAFVPLLSE